MSSARKVYTAIGLMSGTSLDGVDAALIETDGHDTVRPLDFITKPYSEELREALRACFGKAELDDAGREAERLMTLEHAKLVNALKVKGSIIGFHGQTILHDIPGRRTVQIGDANLLSDQTGLDIIYDFRSADVAAGGQGAPLVPIYHRARVMAQNLDLPALILNIGGVANVTYIGKNDELLAFDTGPGNAIMDDLTKMRTGKAYDENGHLAARGMADQNILARWMAHPYFTQKPPKSLDRDAWAIQRDMEALSTEDALATLMVFSVRSIAAAFDHFPEKPKACYVCGGGRRNETMMVALQMGLGCDVRPVETLGWNGDATEAECFGYLAIRCLLGLPISFPGTTGVKTPLTGGLQKIYSV